jgi:hypothetical protein
VANAVVVSASNVSNVERHSANSVVDSSRPLARDSLPPLHSTLPPSHFWDCTNCSTRSLQENRGVELVADKYRRGIVYKYHIINYIIFIRKLCQRVKDMYSNAYIATRISSFMTLISIVAFYATV